jgi:hydrogenase maturation factor
MYSSSPRPLNITEFARSQGPDPLEKCRRFHGYANEVRAAGVFDAMYRIELQGPLDHRILAKDASTGETRELVCFDSNSYLGLHLRVAVGVRAACEAAKTGILGGDTSVGPALAITVVGFGLIPAGQALRRVGLRAGHAVFVAGGVGLGGALAAARVLGVHGFTEDDYAPPVRIAVGRALRGVASTAMDTSDGLIATLDQLARLNGVGIRVETTFSGLLHPRVEALRAAAPLPAFAFVASCHGEFELVFAVPPDRLDQLDGVRATLGAEPLRIGTAYAGEGLCIGDTPIDGARIRNLLDDVGGDPIAYVTALIGMSPP